MPSDPTDLQRTRNSRDVSVLPAFFHDIVPAEVLLTDLPPFSRLAGDKGYISAPLCARVMATSGVPLIAERRKYMPPHTQTDSDFIRGHHRRVETLNGQLAAIGTQQLHARTVEGFLIKVHAALLALVCAFSTSNHGTVNNRFYIPFLAPPLFHFGWVYTG